MLLALPTVAQAQDGTITGVVASEGQRAIVGAQVLLVGVNRSTITDRDGRYTLRNVSPGRVVVRVTAIGHEARQATLTVAAGETVTQDFVLAEQQMSLDELVVTASGEQRKRELGHSIARIDAASTVEEAMPTSFANLLQGRAAGVQILNASGTTGGAARIRIRGASSISLTNEPLLYVDGIRVDNRNQTGGLGQSGQAISRINDFNPDDIESIEIIKGPAAATLYGTEAANGVIRIKTKRGSVGAPRWNMYVEQGAVEDITDFYTNYRTETATGSRCNIQQHSTGTCTIVASQLGNPITGQPLNDPMLSPFKTAHRMQLGANVSGGTDAVQYFFSGEWEKEDGVARLPDFYNDDAIATFGEEIPAYVNRPNNLQRLSFRANARAQVMPNADISVNMGFTSSDVRIQQNDNNSFGVIPSGMLTTVPDDWGFFTPLQVFSVQSPQAVERTTISTAGNWQPLSWLSARGTVGVDFTSQEDIRFQATGTGPPSGLAPQGTRTLNKRTVSQYTADFGATAQFQLTDRISSKTTSGVQYFRNIAREAQTFGQIFPPGAGTQQSATNQVIGEFETEAITLGTFVEQQFGFNDRIFLTGAVRADDNSAFGEDFSAEIYPKISGSWLISEEPWFPESGFLDNLRFRAAWGESGLQPGNNAAVEFFTGVSVPIAGTEQAGVTISNSAAPTLEPERSQEFELGTDLNLMNGRVGVEFTYFNKKTTNALIQRTLPPSLGLSASRWENIGEVSNWGFEGVLNAVILESDGVSWDMTLSASTFQNELKSLPEGVPDLILGNQRHAVGFPLAGFWDNPLLGSTDTGDGIITQNELNIGSEVIFIGESQPRHEASLTNSFEFFNRFRLTGLFDYRGGYMVDNLTEYFRAFFTTNSVGRRDPNASVFEQERNASIDHPLAPASFYEPGWFVKLRELSLTFFAPDQWAESLKIDRLSMTVTGRNLIKWDDYTGADPEVNGQPNVGGNLSFIRDFLTQPQVAYYTARVNLTF